MEVIPAEEGKPFTTIYTGEECAFGESITAEGKLFLEGTMHSTNSVKHLVKELKALSKLTVNGGAKAATLDGSAWVFLSGTHKGMTFSGLPD